MTDFSLSDNYRVHDVKRHEHLCEYQIDIKFVSKTGKIENSGEWTSYFMADVFVDDTIWFALNIVSEFFEINNISINSKKTVAIPINQGIKVLLLNICSHSITIAKKSKAYCYLEIFLFTDDLSKPNVMVRKGLKLKVCLLYDFSDVVLHHSSLYNLKPFMQVQSEVKMAALVSFSNALNILGYLFSHRFLNLQILGWASLNLLQFFVKLRVSPVNNFLAELVKIFLDNKFSLVNNLPNVFYSPGCFPILLVLGKSLYFNFKLDPYGPVSHWFVVASEYLMGLNFFLSGSAESGQLGVIDILRSDKFFVIKNGLHEIWSGFFKVFTNKSLKKAGSAGVTSGVAVYFLVLDLGVDVSVCALFLECVLFSSTVFVHLDNQTAIDACLAKLSSAVPDFCNPEKNLNVAWIKVKKYSGVFNNIKTDLAAGMAAYSSFSLLAKVYEYFLVAENTPVSGNACHFVSDIF
ncbi:hypothetical protein G9A89_020523 [Geosiphon pyriformis]|nr:hypothetical protein G9A89_020523 [Geosiphon pyriformis]